MDELIKKIKNLSKLYKEAEIEREMMEIEKMVKDLNLNQNDMDYIGYIVQETMENHPYYKIESDSYNKTFSKMSKVYYYHTSRLLVTKVGMVPACTIALQMEGDKIKFGVAMCSKYDNFSKKYGRETAVERMNKDFGVIDTKSLKSQFETDHEMCMSQLFNIVNSLVTKPKRWKKKITKFNLEQNKGAIVRELPPLSSYELYPNHK